MTTTSPINGLPVPDDSSPNDPPIHFQALVDQLDTRLVPRFSSTSARDTAIPTPTVGQIALVNGSLYAYGSYGWYKIGGSTGTVVAVSSTGTSGVLTNGSTHQARSVSVPAHTPGRLYMKVSAVWTAPAGAAATFSLQTPSGTDVSGSLVRSTNASQANAPVSVTCECYYWSDGSARTLYLAAAVETNSADITVNEAAFSVWSV